MLHKNTFNNIKIVNRESQFSFFLLERERPNLLGFETSLASLVRLFYRLVQLFCGRKDLFPHFLVAFFSSFSLCFFNLHIQQCRPPLSATPPFLRLSTIGIFLCHCPVTSRRTNPRSTVDFRYGFLQAQYVTLYSSPPPMCGPTEFTGLSAPCCHPPMRRLTTTHRCMDLMPHPIIAFFY